MANVNMNVPSVHLSDIAPRTGFLAGWDRQRHHKFHWFAECFAEALGVFFYTYAGVGSTAPFVLGNIAQQAGLSSILQIGFAYAFGIFFALTVCTSTSGGHFNPAMSIVAVVMHKMPPLKALRYIVAQILGGYIACLLVYSQYSTLIREAEAGLAAAGALEAIQFTPAGTAGIFALYAPAGSHLGLVFLNEFVTDFVIGLVIFSCLDPTNALVPPAMGPVVISLVYAMAVWGFAFPGLAANTARDLGGRLASMTIYGMKGSGGRYAAIAALTNIPATLLAAAVYDLMLKDTDRVVPVAHLEYMRVHKEHARHPDMIALKPTISTVSDGGEKGISREFERT